MSVAPEERGDFLNWGSETDLYLEERCFADLFLRGEGGFLSLNKNAKKPIGFAQYCRNRIKSVDPRFRRDQYYIFFLLLIKEKIEIKRSLQTFMRQARRLPSLTLNNLTDVRLENLEKYNRTYSVYKNLRGSSMYYQSMKSLIQSPSSSK